MSFFTEVLGTIAVRTDLAIVTVGLLLGFPVFERVAQTGSVSMCVRNHRLLSVDQGVTQLLVFLGRISLHVHQILLVVVLLVLVERPVQRVHLTLDAFEVVVLQLLLILVEPLEVFIGFVDSP